MFDQFIPFQQGSLSPQLQFLFILLVIWSIVWKIIALWKASQNGQKMWFVGMFLVNSVGILELIYLGFFQRGEKNIIQKLKEKKFSKKTSSKRK